MRNGELMQRLSVSSLLCSLEMIISFGHIEPRDAAALAPLIAAVKEAFADGEDRFEQAADVIRQLLEPV